jgi:DNA-binding PadR family transcriptional regulator
MKDVLSVFQFREIDEKHIEVLFGLLSLDEKNIFNIINNSSDALTATQVYEQYITNIIKQFPLLKERETYYLKKKENKKISEINSSILRKNNQTVPTQRTITRILENLNNTGFIIKRIPTHSKARAYYSVHPRLKIALTNNFNSKKEGVGVLLTRVKTLRKAIEDYQ